MQMQIRNQKLKPNPKGTKEREEKTTKEQHTSQHNSTEIFINITTTTIINK
jgi:hypothetical protein